MSNDNVKVIPDNLLRALLLLLLITGLMACETIPKSETAMEDKTATAAAEQTTESAPAAAAASAPAETVAEAAAPAEPVIEAPKAPAIVESCKGEPYVDYEKQTRDSMAKGLAATEAGTYGVGFRDLNEHKRWTSIHTQLFTKVNETCQAMSDCAKQNPKNKEEQCAEQAKTFDAWQRLAAQFAEKAKLSETTQPPIICSFEPNLDDPEHCFHDLAANVDAVCDTDACKEVSNCWNGVGFLDAAIAQSKRGCGFVHEPLDKCRGYIEAKGRRMKKFEQCLARQGELNIEVIPPL